MEERGLMHWCRACRVVKIRLAAEGGKKEARCLAKNVNRKQSIVESLNIMTN